MLMVVAPASMAIRTISHEKVAIRARRIFRRELHVVDKRTRQPHRFGGLVERLLRGRSSACTRGADRWRPGRRGCAGAGQTEWRARRSRCLPLGAGQRGDARLANCLGDGGDGGKVALRGHGETGLDDVDAQIFKGMRHGELFLRGHAAAGRLLAIAQSGVEERNVIGDLICSYLTPGTGKPFANSNSFIFSHPRGYKAKLFFLGKRLQLLMRELVRHQS